MREYYCNSIKELLECEYFNDITHLIIGWNGEVDIVENMLPPNLKKLVCGPYFTREIKPYGLPLSLDSLTLGRNYSHKIKENVLPPFLTHFTFEGYWNYKINPKLLPDTLIVLECNNAKLTKFIRQRYITNQINILNTYFPKDISNYCVSIYL